MKAKKSYPSQPKGTNVTEQVKEEAPVVESGINAVSSEGSVEVLKEESVAIAATEVKPEVVVQPVVKPVVTPTVDKTEVAAKVTTVDPYEDMIAGIRRESYPARVGILFNLEGYCKDMAPGKPIDDLVGARHQQNLWRSLLTIIDTCPEEEFRATWNLVLAYFNKNASGALSDRYVFRFMHAWGLGQDQCKAYQAIVNLIKLTMNPQERQRGLKQVSLDKTLPEVISEAGRSKLLSFYKV